MGDDLKAFKTLDQLIELMDSRNILVDEHTKSKLYYDSHYSIVNGYKTLFIHRERQGEYDDIYKNGTTFEEIYSLYNLDRELRALFLKELMRAETFIKNVLCYVFYSQLGDKESYLIADNYNLQKTDRVSELIVNLKCKINKHIEEYTNQEQWKKKHNAISYYNEKHGFIPLWVLMRFLNFSDISKMFSLLKENTQSAIARKITNIYLGNITLPNTYLYTQIRAFVACRNICAHDNIFYKHEYWGGRKTIYVYQCLKFYITAECYSDFTSSLKKILNNFRNDTHFKIISANQILDIMGFSKDWDLQ